MIRKSRLAAVGVLVAGGGLATVLPALPAVGSSSPPVGGIRLESPARIADRGVVAKTAIQIVCPYNDPASVQVQLSERSGHVVATGSAFVQLTCSGTFQSLTVPVVASNAPFSPGVAYGQASVSFSDPTYGYVYDTTSGSVKLLPPK